jgi:glycosyltransferase involved in cell wall biosynthesis
MHVVLFGPLPPPHGGVQTHLVTLRDFLRDSGVRVSVLNITRHRQAEGDGQYYPRSAAGLLARLARLRPDVLHVHLGGNLSTRGLGLCLVCARWPGAVSLLTFHSGGYPSSPAGQAASPRSFAGLALRGLDHLIAVNGEIEQLYHRFGVAPARTSIIEPHGAVALPGGAASLPPPLAEFAQGHQPLFVTVGSFEPEYCFPLVMEALPAIRRKAPGAGLVVVGGAGSAEPEILAAHAASPVRDHILLAGDVPHAATLQLIGRADALLRITAYDGDSVSVREALQLGTPVLATDNGMRPEGVQLLTERSPDALARRALEVIAGPRPPRPTATGDSRNMARVLALYHRLRGNGR